MTPHEPHNMPPAKRPFSIWRFLRRLFVSLVITICLLFGLCIALVYIYEDDVKRLIIGELNKHLQAEVRVEPQDIDLTVISTFPKCALHFRRVTAMEALQKEKKDTLFYAGDILLAFSIRDLLNKKYIIKQFIVQDASLHLAVDKEGRPNYLAWKSSPGGTSDSVNFALEKIILKNTKLDYRNARSRMKCRMRVSNLEFKGLFSEDRYSMVSSGEAMVESLQVQKTKYIADKQLTFNVDLEVTGSSYRFRQADLRLNSMSFNATGSMVYADSLEALSLDYKGKDLEIASVLSLLPEKYQGNIHDYSSDGLFYANGLLSYKSGNPVTVSSEFGIKQATITYKPQSAKLTNVNLDGRFEVNAKTSRLVLRHIQANLGANTFKGECELDQLNNPYIRLAADVQTNLAELYKFYPLDTIQSVSGDLSLSLRIAGQIEDLRHPAPDKDIQAEGTASLKNLEVQLKNSPRHLSVSQGEVKLEATDLLVNDLKLMHGSSDITLVGKMPGFLTYMFDSKAPLTIQAQLNSTKINMDDFLVPSKSGGSPTVSIPANLNFNLDASINHVSFGKFNADQVKGNIYIKDQKLFVKNLELSAMDGKAKLDAFADASGDKIRVSLESDLTGINIQKLFYQFNNFGQTTLEDKHIKGYATATIDFTGTWSRQLEPDLSSVNATSSLLIERGELIGFKPLESLGKYIEVKELQHIRFSTLQSAVEIKNKTITIPKTSIKSSAINIEFSGRHTFDNAIDYHIQLLLSELLAKRRRANHQLDDELNPVENDPENRRSVFILMTGTVDNPIIKYDKKGAKEKIKQDIKQEKQNLKQILKEEFGLFKKDTTTVKKENLSDQKFKLDVGGNKKPQPTLEPKKKADDDDF